MSAARVPDDSHPESRRSQALEQLRRYRGRLDGMSREDLHSHIETLEARQVDLEMRIEQLGCGGDATSAPNGALEHRVAERTGELAQIVETLQAEVARRSLAEKTLRRRSEQLRELASQLTLTEQRERLRLARLLHDGLQQLLVAARFRLSTLVRCEDVAVARQVAAQVSETICDAIDTSRNLTAELTPPILHEGGLAPALEWLARWMHHRHGLAVVLDVCDSVESLGEEPEILMFQAARELLFNAAKHAQVDRARVEVRQGDDCLRMTVSDKGAGFDPSELRTGGATTGGFGLFSIAERLELLGGSLETESTPGEGSRFTLTVPLAVGKDRQTEADLPSLAPRESRDGKVDGRIRVVLVDDHVVMRQGLATLLRDEEDIVIVGEASDGPTAVRLAKKIRPDVMLMDVSMPGMSGVEATRIIRSEAPGVSVIGLSMFDEAERAGTMREAGAEDYLVKTGPAEALMVAIRTCADRVRQGTRT